MENLKNFEFFIFDLDGTLVDSSKDIADAANFARKQMGMGPLSVATINHYVGRGVIRLLENVFETEDHEILQKAQKLFLGYYADHLLDHTCLFPGVLDFLNKNQNRKKAILTNKPSASSRKIIKGLGIESFFLHVIGGDSSFPQKPDPSALLWLLEQERVPPSKALFFGDSLVDFETAQGGGIACVLTTQGFGLKRDIESASCYQQIHHFHDLLPIKK